MIDHAPNRLGELMDAKGATLRDLAIILDVTEDTIRRFKANRGGPIPSQYIPSLAAFLGVDPAHLMGWDRESAEAQKAAAA